MRNDFRPFGIAFLVVTATAVTALCAQNAAVPAQGQGAGRGPAPLAIPNPSYVTIPLEITVNRPAADVWKRIGKYCDIGEWLRVPCTILSGKDGEVGAVRSVANEILVGKTELS